MDAHWWIGFFCKSWWWMIGLALWLWLTWKLEKGAE